MPGLDLSGQLVGAGFNAVAEDWASIDGGGSLNLIANIEAKRGIDLNLGLEALLNLNASFQKYIAADLSGEAHARAAVRAQVQVPMDIFNEAGAAVRLEATAEAAAGVSLSIGLNIGDFLELAGQDERIQGLPLRLLEIFLTELEIKAGVYAKAAVAAMAYAKVSLTAKLSDGLGEKSGFEIGGEAGAGLEAGAGFRVYGTFGVQDPRRLVRRTIDVAVDEAMDQLGSLLPAGIPEARKIIDATRTPAKMALRTAFELGLEMRGASFTFDVDSAEKMAIRCVQILLEEAQRFLLQKLADVAADLFKEFLESAGIDSTTWDCAEAERQSFAQHLLAVPEDPFEDTPENKQYWTDLVKEAIDVAIKLADPDGEWNDWVAAIWGAVQLLIVSTSRVSQASASVSAMGIGPREVKPAFSGVLSADPPPEVRKAINRALGRAEDAALNQDALIEYLVRDVLLQEIDNRFPEVSEFLSIFARQTGDEHVQIARTLLTSLNAFRPGAAGSRDPKATLDVIIGGLQDFVHNRLDAVVMPVIREQMGDSEAMQLYANEVISPSLHFTTNVILGEVRNWEGSSNERIAALREACSSVVVKLFGRSLVVSLDALMAAAQGQIRDQMYLAAGHVNDNRGIAEKINSLVPGLDREVIAELCEITLQIGGDVFGPLPDSTRRTIRTLLYESIETLPPNADIDFVGQLADSFFIPNLDTLSTLAEELAKVIASNFEKFVSQLLNCLAELVLKEFQEFIEGVIKEIQAWLDGTEKALAELAKTLMDLLRQIDELRQLVEGYWNSALDEAEALLNLVGSSSARSRIRTEIGKKVLSEAEGVLCDNAVYKNVPDWAKSAARTALESSVWAILNNALLDNLMDFLGDAALELEEFIQDVRGIDPERNLTDQILSLVLDRVEDRVRDHFGSRDPSISLSFPVSISATFFGQEFSVNETINLGSFSIPLSQISSAVRWALQQLFTLEDSARSLADEVSRAFTGEIDLHVKEQEQESTAEAHTEVSRILAEAHADGIDVSVFSPVPGAHIESDLRLKISLQRVPFSFLGLGEREPQRVFVTLNHVPQPMTLFTVIENGFTGSITAGVEASTGAYMVPIHRMATTAESGWTGYSTEGKASAVKMTILDGRSDSVIRYQPGDLVDRWGRRHEAVAHVVAQQKSAPHFAANKVPATHSVAARVYKNRGALAGNQPSLAVVRNAVSQPKPKVSLLTGPGFARNDQTKKIGGRSQGTKPGSAPTLGRFPTLTAEAQLEGVAEPGLTLTITIPFYELEPGINTVSVAVVDGRNQRVVETVSFFVSAPVADDKSDADDSAFQKVPDWALPKALEPMTINVIGSKPKPKRSPRGSTGRPSPDNSIGRGPTATRKTQLFVPRAERRKRIAYAKKSVSTELKKNTHSIAEVVDTAKKLSRTKRWSLTTKHKIRDPKKHTSVQEEKE